MQITLSREAVEVVMRALDSYINECERNRERARSETYREVWLKRSETAHDLWDVFHTAHCKGE